MSNTFILILLAAVFGMFVFFLVTAAKGGGSPNKAPVAAAVVPGVKKEHLQIEVNPKDNGVEILVYNSWEERPSDAELFPDIVNDVAPPKGALDRDLWEKVARLGNIADPAEREQIVRTLAEHGVIPKEAVSNWSMPAPDADMMPDEDDDEDDYRSELAREMETIVPDDEEGFYFDY